jgi:hypothetical protein
LEGVLGNNRIAGYSLYNDCAISVARAAPLTLLGDAWLYSSSPENDAAIVFVFPFEQHVHDYGHVQIMARALMMTIGYMQFVSYTTVLLFARETHHLPATSRAMAQDIELSLAQHVPWPNAASSPTFACSTMLKTGSKNDSCDSGTCAETEGPGAEGAAVGGGAGGLPLMVVVAVGRTGEGWPRARGI